MFSPMQTSQYDLQNDEVIQQDQQVPSSERAATLRPDQDGQWRITTLVWVADKPGELADICSFMGNRQANIEYFSFNRSQDPHRVELEVRTATGESAGAIVQGLAERDRLFPPHEGQGEEASEPGVTEVGGLLKIKVYMMDRPGAMAELAKVFKEHQANVIHMTYDGSAEPGLISVAMATRSPDQVAALLERMNLDRYHYHVEWRGEENVDMDRVIGLNEVETFLLRLKSMLPEDKAGGIEDLIRSSDELRRTLASFRREAGENVEAMAASEVFTKILELAAASVTRTGVHFSLRLTGPLRVTEAVRLYMLTCPTGANAYLLVGKEEYVLVDSSYGHYFPDVVKWLMAHGLDPSRIRRALISHADADHAGWAAPLEREFSTEIYMHPQSREVLDKENRAQGSDTKLLKLNGSYTKLINRFTDLNAPKDILPFPAHPTGGERNGFPVVGQVTVEDMTLTVLESLGGHIPGQVFFLCESEGLLFSGDYLIDVPSLSERSKSTLSIARFLVTSTNSDSRVFGREMDMLKSLMIDLHREVSPRGKTPRVFPGHGDYYCVADTDWAENND
ncbi:MAG: MBL fold metallo-hydrolase [Desulfovibrio sp.]|nr:MAG: MBL fold metallo-hydrolase [Desulfovibrio sp.]